MQLYPYILMQLVWQIYPFCIKNVARKYIQVDHSLDLTLQILTYAGLRKQWGNLKCAKYFAATVIILKRISVYPTLKVVIIMSPYNDDALMIRIVIDLFQNNRIWSDTKKSHIST